MALNIKDDTADRLARELAAATGESITTAVTTAVRERLERVRGSVPRKQRAQALSTIAARSAARRVRDRRSAEDIVGYGLAAELPQLARRTFVAMDQRVELERVDLAGIKSREPFPDPLKQR